jgi:ppGpp synthetase/RelA/SpoT-type nucleotidyltranferase
LQAWRRRHEHVVQKAVSVMRAIGFEPTPRVKTLNTLVEKLVREQSMKLSRVQDIAGVRIVVEGQLRTQDAV